VLWDSFKNLLGWAFKNNIKMITSISKELYEVQRTLRSSNSKLYR